MALAFLNYRRDDTSEAALAIYTQLKVHFGSGQLFMDVNSLTPGEPWPARIQDKAHTASGFLAIIGERWLHCFDQWGRRRIDDVDDWVFLELKHAFELDIPVVPVLVGSAVVMPPAMALPPGIARLADVQAYRVTRENWIRDLNALVAICHERFGLAEDVELRGVVGPYPDPDVAKKPRVDDEVLHQFFARTSGWEAWEDAVAREYPHRRQELRKNFTFSSFKDAIEFMYRAAGVFNKLKHHPRWSNEWRLVTVRLSTWDASNKITDIDLETADALDTLYTGFREERRLARVQRAAAAK